MWLCDEINIKSYRPVKVHPHISLQSCETTSSLRKNAHSAQHFVGFLKKMMKDEYLQCLFKIKSLKHKTLDLSRWSSMDHLPVKCQTPALKLE